MRADCGRPSHTGSDPDADADSVAITLALAASAVGRRLSAHAAADVAPDALDAGTLDAALDAATGRDPQLAAVLNAQVRALVSSGISYLAFDFDPLSRARNLATSLNVLKTTVPAGVSLAFIADTSAAQLEQLDAVQKPVSRRKLTIGATDSEELRFQMTQGEVRLGTTQYLS